MGQLSKRIAQNLKQATPKMPQNHMTKPRPKVMKEKSKPANTNWEKLLPPEAVKELHEWYVTSPEDKVDVVKDPKVGGSYAVRITPKNPQFGDDSFGLLWNHGAWDEVEFTTWPPTSGEPQILW